MRTLLTLDSSEMFSPENKSLIGPVLLQKTKVSLVGDNRVNTFYSASDK